MEEALISRVSACTSVLSLPNGGQLGYKGSVINFTNDLGYVVEQLPRTPKETGIIVYAVEGTRRDGRAYRALVEVRREAIYDHLRFLATHHTVYKSGIQDADGEYLVQPFTLKDLDTDEKGPKGAKGHSAILWKRCEALPEQGIPEGIDERSLAVQEGCGADEDLHTRNTEASDDGLSDDGDSLNSDSGNESDGEPRARSRQKKCAPPRTLEEREARDQPVREDLFARWLVHSRGPVAQDLRATLAGCGIDVGSGTGRALEDTLIFLHESTSSSPRDTSKFTVAYLSKRLHGLKSSDAR